MNTSISNARLASMVKAVAKNVSDIVKRKQKLVELMEKTEAKYKDLLEKQLARYKEDYEALVEQQELFEAPIRKLTNGYSTEDLVITEIVETGVDKNGKPTRATRYTLKYPDTIVPPETTEEAATTEAEVIDTPAPETEEQAKPFEGIDDAELPENEQEMAADDLPFGN